jgi:hypothetical protein
LRNCGAHHQAGGPIDGAIGSSSLQFTKQDLALSPVDSPCRSFADRLGDLSITDRKIQSRFATYEKNTGVLHPFFSWNNQLSGRTSGNPLLTDGTAQL